MWFIDYSCTVIHEAAGVLLQHFIIFHRILWCITWRSCKSAVGGIGSSPWSLSPLNWSTMYLCDLCSEGNSLARMCIVKQLVCDDCTSYKWWGCNLCSTSKFELHLQPCVLSIMVNVSLLAHLSWKCIVNILCITHVMDGYKRTVQDSLKIWIANQLLLVGLV